MIIGTPIEIKEDERRVAMVPDLAKKLVENGHEVWVQTNAGIASGFTDDDYKAAGATIANTLEEVYAKADLITKVKELQPQEFDLIRENQMIFTWFHLAEDYDKPMAQALIDHKSIGLSMELIVLDDGSRPTMKPMSDIAGSLATIESIKYCQATNGGTGLMLRKINGLRAPRVVILGGGRAGYNAADVAIGLGLEVSIIEASYDRMDWLKSALPTAKVIYYSAAALERELIDCDVFINCIYPSPEPGKREPMVKRETVRKMKKCSLIMDIAGAEIIETARYTTISNPTYVEEGILHYNVPNMPALVPKTATEALLMITTPYILAIANKGLKKAAQDDPSLRRCISTVNGQIVHSEIGINQEMPYVEFDFNMLEE